MVRWEWTAEVGELSGETPFTRLLESVHGVVGDPGLLVWWSDSFQRNCQRHGNAFGTLGP